MGQTQRAALARLPGALTRIGVLSGLAGLVVLLANNGPQPAQALENGLARTPPMGWMAWERFTCETNCAKYPAGCINGRLFKRMADHLFEDGWLAAGYSYLNIDDCWSEMARDTTSGQLVPDLGRFYSDGILELANYVHKYDNLKLGIYGDCGTKTCGGYPGQLRAGDQPNKTHEQDDLSPGSATYFELDAQTFARWQVDSLKFDGCFVDPLKAERICPRMAEALASTKRPILLTCEWPFYMMYAHAEADWDLAAASCNMWRYYDDIDDSWLSVLNTIDHTVRHQARMVKHHGPGHWFDPDQLVIGNFGLSVAQARAQMALWCLWSAPLFMSNDLGAMGPEFAQILKNKHLIGVDQDRLGVLGLMVAQEPPGAQPGLSQAFVKPLEPVSPTTGCPSFAVVYLNRATLGNRRKVAFKLADLLRAAPIRQAAKSQARVWAHEGGQGRSAGQELDELLGSSANSSTAHSGRTGAQIRPGECLEWLSGQRAGPPLAFQLLDLFQDAKPIGSVRTNESLELLVEPSSVRMLRLVELSHS